MMLEESGCDDMRILEIDNDIMIKACELHGYLYTIITKDDIVIPPEIEHDFI